MNFSNRILIPNPRDFFQIYSLSESQLLWRLYGIKKKNCSPNLNQSFNYVETDQAPSQTRNGQANIPVRYGFNFVDAIPTKKRTYVTDFRLLLSSGIPGIFYKIEPAFYDENLHAKTNRSPICARFSNCSQLTHSPNS